MSTITRKMLIVNADDFGLSIGLHLDFGEWEYRNGEWAGVYQVLPQERVDDPSAITAEVAAQLIRFRELMGQDPTHLDSHQHVHQHEPLRTVLQQFAAELRIPVRHLDKSITYCGNFYGQSGRGEPYPEGIEAETLCSMIRALPVGVTELGCHPGFGCDFRSSYTNERELEVAALCGLRVRAVLEEADVTLCSFREIATL